MTSTARVARFRARDAIGTVVVAVEVSEADVAALELAVGPAVLPRGLDHSREDLARAIGELLRSLPRDT